MLRVLVAGSVFAILMLLGSGGLVLWAASAVDRIQEAKETALVERRLERLNSAMVDDLKSATIWNDAVVAVSNRDMDWMQINFGDYYADYMGHEVTVVFDGAGDLLLASRESEPVGESDVASLTAATSAILRDVQRDSRSAARRAGAAFGAEASRSGVVQADGKAWLIAASTVVPEDATIARPDADAVVISAKPLSFVVDSLGADLKLRGATFTTSDPGHAAVAVSGPDGRVLGWLQWMPDRPGTAVVIEAAPYLVALLLVLSAAAGGLFVWLRRAGRRLAASEAALIDARDRAEAASEAKSCFLSNMSHELRTPLNGVVAMGEIMALDELSPAQRERLDVLRTSGQELLKMIEQLLQVTRLGKGHLLVERSAYDPASTALAVARGHEAAARAKGLDLETRLADVGPRLGDGRHVAQVLEYLIDNAVTYTSRGKVTVSLAAADERITFEISDTGPGIPDQLLPHIFEVFTRGDDSLTSASGGAGLGLSICRDLVEALGGKIAVHSMSGEGTTVMVDLPAPVAATPDEALAA